MLDFLGAGLALASFFTRAAALMLALLLMVQENALNFFVHLHLVVFLAMAGAADLERRLLEEGSGGLRSGAPWLAHTFLSLFNGGMIRILVHLNLEDVAIIT